MAIKDTNNTGLLSKVAKFVRNPTTNWTDLDKQDPEPDNVYSKQALKEMIERKRQNDFVRKREFDQLRKLRNRDPSAGNPDLAGRPSYFQSSLPANPGERASTIKKIDEIEAQMSNQWWQGKTDTAKPAGAGVGEPAGKGGAAWPDQPAPVPAGSGSPFSDSGFAATKLAPMAPHAARPESSPFMPTQVASSFGAAPELAQAMAPAPPAAKGVPSTPAFANSQSFAVEMIEFVNDGDLEEAAIRFANGDNEGAEAALREAVKTAGTSHEQIENWSAALFDLYRATGQQNQFDSVAIDFAERFGRSAPAWFSMPDMLGIKVARSTVRTMPSRLEDAPIWSSPAHFTASSVDELELALANAPSPWFLDWGPLVSVDADAVEPFAAVVAEWAARPVHLRFGHADKLDEVLHACTPSGNKAVRQIWWRLRMDALRILGRQDEFELVALEYCVTYEVSPPAWQDVRCDYVQEGVDQSRADGSKAPGLTDNEDDDTQPDGLDHDGLTVPMGYDSAPAAVVELAGDIIGEATDALARLEAARQGGDRLVISCANLIRVDFSAAGSILNWVATRQSEGCNVQFRDVHRLVAAFFHVIGIHEHARIVLRSN